VDYLYKALGREIGVAKSDLVSFSPSKAQRAELVARGRKHESTTPARARLGKVVPFPVNLERLYVLQNEATAKEHLHVWEQYRVLRSRILETMRAQRMRTLMISSALSGECKTTTSINLAFALSQVQGIKVLLVDTDLRKPGIAEVLGIPYELGLDDYLRSSVPLSDLLLQLTDSLFLVPSGGVDQNSVELLHSAAMVAFVNEVQSNFDLIVFDTPPMFPVADARVTANLVDAVLFCVRAGKTSETIVSEAIALIRPKLIGTVLVGAEVRPGGCYYYSGSSLKE
jgi:capsular exopolysaccharide synthesis family protein